MNKPVNLILDLDGTISDPIEGIYRSINHALDSFGFRKVSMLAVARLIGPPLDEGFRSLLPDENEKMICRLVSKYRERYATVGFSENSIYEGVAEALDDLVSRGVSLGVCTSKRVDFAEKILELFNIRRHFEFVDGGDVGIQKSKQIQGLLSTGLVSTTSTMIGDRAIDILAAHTNRLPAVGVLWGYGSEQELVEAGASTIIKNASELLRLSVAA